MKKLLPEHLEEFEKILQHLYTEFSQLRTGRATPALVENITVNAYGSHMPLQQLASLSTPDSHTLAIQAWDKTVLADIEKALLAANLGIQPVNAGEVIRLSFPPLTQERRTEIVRVAKQKFEEARVAVRLLRERILKSWKESLKSGEISEDEFYLSEEALQEKIKSVHDTLQNALDKKEQEILSLSQ